MFDPGVFPRKLTHMYLLLRSAAVTHPVPLAAPDRAFDMRGVSEQVVT